MTKKTKIGIIGTGNLGSDLLFKILRSKHLECALFVGQNAKSENILRAKKMGVPTSSDSIDAFVINPNSCEIVFDATTAEAHRKHAIVFSKLKLFTIDLTPSRVGKMCIPYLNLEESLAEKNINMVTCGGQATAPLISAIKKIHPEIEYVEIVASIASKSAGIGTRNNIDEYTQTTAEGMRFFTKIKNTKAIIILNPSEPPILMHNTIYVSIKRPNLKQINKELENVERSIKNYVPGYSISMYPVFENERLTLMNQVIGKGDFLPKYAGNLDIINSAAVAVAEEYSKRKLNKN